MLGLQALLAAALLAVPMPARAADPEKDPLKDLGRRVENLEKGMTEIQNTAAAIRAEGLKISILKSGLDKLATQLDKMQAVVEALKKDLGGKERLAAYPPDAVDDLAKRVAELEKKVGGSARVAKAAPEVGRILLFNRYAEEVTVHLNGRGYRVLPGQTARVESFPAGVFTYQIESPTWGLRERVTSTVPVNETVRLTVE
jgi:hypothetical protein